MDIVKNIDADIVSFMKNQDKANLTTLRMAKNALQSEKIRVNHELNDDEIINTLKKFVKQKKDNIEEYTKYGKDDIVNDLKREVELNLPLFKYFYLCCRLKVWHFYVRHFKVWHFKIWN